MLEFAKIKRFKILMEADFPLSNLNIFSGLNGMGKSSLIQTLLLLRQSYERNALFSQSNAKNQGLLLQGDYANLGIGKDVWSMKADEESIDFYLNGKILMPLIFYLSINKTQIYYPYQKLSIQQT